MELSPLLSTYNTALTTSPSPDDISRTANHLPPQLAPTPEPRPPLTPSVANNTHSGWPLLLGPVRLRPTSTSSSTTAAQPPSISLSHQTQPAGGLIEAYISDNYKITTPGSPLIGGLRQSHFEGDITDNYTAPRIGLALEHSKTPLGLSRILRTLLSASPATSPLAARPQPSLPEPTTFRTSPSAPAPALFLCTANATKNISSACRFPSAAGCSMPTPSRPAPTTSSTTPTSATPASTIPVTVQGALIQRLGTQPSAAPRLWHLRPVPPRLLEPNRPAARPHHRRPHLHPSSALPRVRCRLLLPAQLTTTSATPSMSGFNSTLPHQHHRLDQRLLRLRLHQRRLRSRRPASPTHATPNPYLPSTPPLTSPSAKPSPKN